MSKGHITAYHPTKGARRFSLGIWAAMGPDKQGFTERAPMPNELKATKITVPIEGGEMTMETAGDTSMIRTNQTFEIAVPAAKKGRKPKAI